MPGLPARPQVVCGWEARGETARETAAAALKGFASRACWTASPGFRARWTESPEGTRFGICQRTPARGLCSSESSASDGAREITGRRGSEAESPWRASAQHDTVCGRAGALLESLRYALPRDRKLPLQTWLHGAASRMHRSRALETAACAFGSQIVGQYNNNENVSTESRLAYRKSLWYLQRALYHPQEWKSSETLGALLILCYYQVRYISDERIMYTSIGSQM